MTRHISVEEMLDTPPGRDEFGPPDDEIERCERHDVRYHEDSRCLRCEREREGESA